jgi:hypothetical protein
VTFHNADSGFCVLRLNVKGERDLITLIGHAPTVTPGEYAAASGNWVTDREHGRQFRAVFVKIAPPNTLSGIECGATLSVAARVASRRNVTRLLVVVPLFFFALYFNGRRLWACGRRLRRWATQAAQRRVVHGRSRCAAGASSTCP